MSKFNAEQSKEIRQWILLLGGLALSTWLEIKYENSAYRNYRNNKNRTTFDIEEVWKSYDDLLKQEKENGAKLDKEIELNKAVMNKEKIIKFTKSQWNERYSRYSLIKQTHGIDGYYVPDYGEGRVYIYIIES